MDTIPLTKNKFAIVDAEDFVLLNQWKWHLTGENYAQRVEYRKHNGKTIRKYILMHRFLTNIANNLEVDHKNGNGLDNRKINLRICSRLQNSRNRKMGKNNTSGIKGVSFDGSTTNKDKKWMARIKINGKLLNLGRYLTKEEAGLVYKLASERYFGEYRRA